MKSNVGSILLPPGLLLAGFSPPLLLSEPGGGPPSSAAGSCTASSLPLCLSPALHSGDENVELTPPLPQKRDVEDALSTCQTRSRRLGSAAGCQHCCLHIIHPLIL